MSAEEPPLAPPDKQPPDLKLPEPVEKTVGFAIVGLGQLALEEIMPAFAQCKLARPTALVSGHPDKAKRIAAAYGIDPKHIYDYQSYDRLRDDPAVSAVYIVLPNSMHAEYTIRGLKAGKHVLCEKPMATTAADCKAMIAAARDAKRKLMVAYRLHYEPFIRPLIGMGGDELLPKVCGLDAESQEGKQISDRRAAIFLSEHLPKLRACRGAEELLHQLKARGLKLAVASSAKKGELDPLLKVCGADRLIETATSSDDADRSKPDPDIVHAALGEIGFPPNEVVLVGDTPYDVEAGRKAGGAGDRTPVG